MLKMTFTVAWGSSPSLKVRTASIMEATPTLSSPPRTVVPSERMTPSSMTGVTLSHGCTQSRCAVMMTDPEAVPGSTAYRLPVSEPVRSPASSISTVHPHARNAAAQYSAAAPSCPDGELVVTRSRNVLSRRSLFMKMPLSFAQSSRR